MLTVPNHPEIALLPLSLYPPNDQTHSLVAKASHLTTKMWCAVGDVWFNCGLYP